MPQIVSVLLGRLYDQFKSAQRAGVAQLPELARLIMAGGSKQRAGTITTLFKKAKLITEAEARYIISHATKSTSEWVVIQYMDEWFDMRGLTEAEIADLLEDLDRKWAAELAAGIANPH